MAKLLETPLKTEKMIEKQITRMMKKRKVKKFQAVGEHADNKRLALVEQTETRIRRKRNNADEIAAQKKIKHSLHSDGTVTELNCQVFDVLHKNKVIINQTSGKQINTEIKNSQVSNIFNTLYSRFNSHKNPCKAVAMSKYMRNQFEFFGIQTPERRALYKELWREVKQLNPSEIRALVNLTWQSPEREFQLFTIELLEKERCNIFVKGGEISGDAALKTVEFIKSFLVDNKSWWDTVDTLAIKVKLCPDELLPVMDQWNIDDNFWLCRTSIIYQNSFKTNTDEERLFKYCLTTVHCEEFFIQKAVGWALREYYKVNPASVKAFVRENKNILSSLSIREALKHDK